MNNLKAFSPPHRLLQNSKKVSHRGVKVSNIISQFVIPANAGISLLFDFILFDTLDKTMTLMSLTACRGVKLMQKCKSSTGSE
jgi:hypothetical protein